MWFLLYLSNGFSPNAGNILSKVKRYTVVNKGYNYIYTDEHGGQPICCFSALEMAMDETKVPEQGTSILQDLPLTPFYTNTDTKNLSTTLQYNEGVLYWGYFLKPN